MAPDDRRKAIVDATTPLILEYGSDVSTRQIADACGLAEGTLFRAFENKDAILRAVVVHLLDPDDLITRIGEIDLDDPLKTRVDKILEIITEATARVRALMMVFHKGSFGQDRDPEADHRFMLDRHARIDAALAAVLEPDADTLRVTPAVAAAFLHGSVITVAMHHMLNTPLKDPALMADLLYHAISKESDA